MGCVDVLLWSRDIGIGSASAVILLITIFSAHATVAFCQAVPGVVAPARSSVNPNSASHSTSLETQPTSMEVPASPSWLDPGGFSQFGPDPAPTPVARFGLTTEHADTFSRLNHRFEGGEKRLTLTAAEERLNRLVSRAAIDERHSILQWNHSSASYQIAKSLDGHEMPAYKGPSSHPLDAIISSEILGFQSSDQLLLYMHGFSPFANPYGAFYALEYHERKNDFWRVAFGLNRNILKPFESSTLNYLCKLDPGNTCFLFEQLRFERFQNQIDNEGGGQEVTLKSASGISSNPPVLPDTSFSDSSGWSNIPGRVALGFGSLAEWTGPQIPGRWDGDAASIARLRKQYGFGKLIWDPTDNVQLGFQVSRYETDWKLVNVDGNHSWVFNTRISIRF